MKKNLARRREAACTGHENDILRPSEVETSVVVSAQ